MSITSDPSRRVKYSGPRQVMCVRSSTWTVEPVELVTGGHRRTDSMSVWETGVPERNPNRCPFHVSIWEPPHIEEICTRKREHGMRTVGVCIIRVYRSNCISRDAFTSSRRTRSVVMRAILSKKLRHAPEFDFILFHTNTARLRCRDDEWTPVSIDMDALMIEVRDSCRM